MAKSKIAKKVVDVENSVVTFQFADQTNFTADVSKLDSEMLDRLALHGLSQKLGDSYAGAESIDEAKAAVKGLWDQLVNNVWSTKTSRGGIWVEAIVRALGIEFDEALKKWNDKTEEEQKAIKKHPHVVKAKLDIEAERAAKAAQSMKDVPKLSL